MVGDDDACTQNGLLHDHYSNDLNGNAEESSRGKYAPSFQNGFQFDFVPPPTSAASLADCKTPIHVEFEWFQDTPPAHSIYLMGSFNGWTDAVQLHAVKQTNDTDSNGDPLPRVCYRTKIPLLRGTHEFKFIVDGRWMCSKYYERCYNGPLENNVMHI